MSTPFDLDLLVASPVAAIAGAACVKIYDWFKDGRSERRRELASASEAHTALNSDLRASMKVLVEEVARLRMERDLETARLAAVVKAMQVELEEARAQSTRKDARITELEREIALLHQKVFGQAESPESSITTE